MENVVIGGSAEAGLLPNLFADTSAPDIYTAESALWHLDRFEPGPRIVLAAHNVRRMAVCTFEGLRGEMDTGVDQRLVPRVRHDHEGFPGP